MPAHPIYFSSKVYATGYESRISQPFLRNLCPNLHNPDQDFSRRQETSSSPFPPYNPFLLPISAIRQPNVRKFSLFGIDRTN